MAPRKHPKPNAGSTRKSSTTSNTTNTKQSLLPHGASKRTSLPPPPHNWPKNITYLHHPYYPPTFPTSLLLVLNPSKPPIFHPPHPSLRIKLITSPPTHPALNQLGLFTVSVLLPGTHLLDYLGRVHDGPDAESEVSDYDLSLDRELGKGVGVDAARWGNEGRFFNDYRGVDERGANCEFYDVLRGEEKRVGVRVKRRIERGEECLVSYGKGFWWVRMKEKG